LTKYLYLFIYTHNGDGTFQNFPYIKFRKTPFNRCWNAIWAATSRWCLYFSRQIPQWKYLERLNK